MSVKLHLLPLGLDPSLDHLRLLVFLRVASGLHHESVNFLVSPSIDFVNFFVIFVIGLIDKSKFAKLKAV